MRIIIDWINRVMYPRIQVNGDTAGKALKKLADRMKA